MLNVIFANLCTLNECVCARHFAAAVSLHIDYTFQLSDFLSFGCQHIFYVQNLFMIMFI